MKTFFRNTIAASLLFLAGLSYGQSGNLQYFKVGSDTILYNLDDVYEVIDLNSQVAMRFFKPTISVTATMTMEQFMARACDQFVQVTVSPSGQERAFSKRFITHVKKDGNSGKAALYMMELNRTQLTEETVPYIIANYTSCGSSGGDGGGSESTVDTFYYTGDTIVLRTTEDTFALAVTDETIEIGPTSLIMCGSSHAPGAKVRDVFEGINDCFESYEVQLHPAVTLASGSNRALTLDTVNQVLELNLDADDSYDNNVSGLTSISIQDAIDELAARSSVLDGPFLVFELDTTLTNESQLVPDSTMYLTTSGDTTTIGVVAGGISIVHLDSLLRDSIFVDNAAWLLDGNTIGGPGKFLGTIDSQRLYFKTDNLDRLWISDAEDRVYLGDSLYYGTMVFDTLSGEGLVFSTYRDVTSPESDPIRFRIKSDGSKTIFHEPLSIHEQWVEIGLGIKDNAGSLGTAGQVATSDGTGWNWEDVDALPDGERGETLWNNGSGWTVDSTIMNVGDSVSIIANSNLPFRVNNGTNNVFRTHNDGKTYWSDGTYPASLFPVASTSATASVSSGIGLMVYSNSPTGTNYSAFAVSGVPLFSTTGSTYNIYSVKNFTPTSGSAQHTNTYVGGTVNQTGSASGTTRGIHIDHTLTAASAYRALDISTVGGTGIYQSSTSTINQLRGSTIIGAVGTPVRTLHVSGTARITGSVVGADGLLGVNLTNGDVTHLILGDGFTISNDTATATVSVEGWTVSDGTNQEQIAGETLTFTGINGATVTFDSTTNTIEFDGNGGGGGPAGENNVGLNLGGGYEVYKTKSDTTFIFRTLDPEGILTITQNDTTLIMTATEEDGDSTNELQVVDTFDLSSGYLRISLSDEDSLHTVLLDSLLGWYADADTGDSNDLIAGDTVHFVGANGVVIDYDTATKTFTVDGAAYVLPPGVSTQTLRYDINDSLVANSVLINDGSRLAINTTILSPYDLRTNADIQVNGVRVGAPGDSTNVLVGSGIPSVSGGINNTVVGDLAMTGLTSGDYNTSVGYRSAYGLTSGQYNTFMGMGSGQSVTTQSSLTAFGYHALYGATGVHNTAVGYFAMNGTGSGGYNSAYGYGSLQANTSGNYNTALGRNALAANTTGSSNIAIGYNALDATTTIANNIAVGNDALGDITAGAFNAAVGGEALATNTSSSGNAALGYQAGKNTANGGGSVFLGYKSGLNYTTQDSVLIIESGADSVGLITGDFPNNRVGINLGPASTGRTLDVNGEVRIRDLTTTNPSRLTGADANGVLNGVKLGTNLSFSNDTLNATGGGGAWPYGDFNPTYLGGVNGTKDSITDTRVAFYDDPGVSSGYYWAHNTRIQNDTIHALRGSYFQGYESTAWNKTVAQSSTDTINIDQDDLFDFTEAGGAYTYNQPAQYGYVPEGFSYWGHRFKLGGTISISTPAAADAKLFLYVNGFVENACTVEFSTPGSDRKEVVHLSCSVFVVDGDVLDLRIQNDESGSVTYLIERANFNGHHIKSQLIPAF